ncbi:MAG: ethanolamine utilization protein EutH [Ruminococcaceae bacterium]|nr:ethanolamine utilization protein EutH [Oscillospiraceae bacterium]
MTILMFIFAVFAILGAVDRIIGNRFGVGQEFEKGIMATGSLALSMVGMICIAPSFTKILIPVITPVAKVFHFDPSVIIGCVLANDLGGASLAESLAQEEIYGAFNGLIVASMLGATISFTIPVALRSIKKELHKEVLLGILCGIGTIPVGCIASGLMLGISFKDLLLNLAPVIVIAVITCIGIIKAPNLSVKIFKILGHLIVCLVTIGLVGGIFKSLTGKTLIPGMTDILEGFEIVANIGIILAGVFPLIFVVSKVLGKVFAKFGKVLKINDVSVMGFISSLANSIPTFEMAEKMDKKGIIMNMAFVVSGSFVFGDHLAFTMAFDKKYVAAMILGKLISAVCATVAAAFIYKINYEKKTEK